MKFCLFLLAFLAADTPTVNWPAFRGAEANGLAVAKVPVSWNADAEKGPLKNIRWKTPIEGLSHSSPIVWGDRVYVATVVSRAGAAPLKVGLYGAGDPADDDGLQSWVLYCLDKKSGRVVWKTTAYEGKPKTRRHTKATHLNTTPVTDGRRIVLYLGSEGLHVFSMDGKLQWKKDLGTFDVGPQGYDLQWGVANSPALFENHIVLQCDQKKGSFLVVFSADGKELWRTPRDGVSNHSWATPAVFREAGRTQIVCNGWPFITGYDFATGKELWRLKSGGDIPVPTPVSAHGLIYVTNAHGGGAPLYAIRPYASGDISLPANEKSSGGVVWSEPRNGAYMQTPLILGDLLYSCSDRGVLKVYDAKTGALRYTQRLGAGTSGFSSSPVSAGGALFFASEEGEIYAVKPGPEFELLATSQMGEIVMATPAVSNNVLYYRTRGHLVAVGEQ